MMKGIRYLIAILAVLPCLSMSAQTLTSREIRSYNYMILNLMEDYEQYDGVFDDNSVAAFRSLFIDDNAPIQSDILEYKFGKSIPVSEYISQLSEKENTQTIIKNLVRGDYYMKDGACHCVVTFDKSISYNDSNGVLFSMEEYFGKDLTVKVTCVYVQDAEKFKIESISTEMTSPVMPLSDKFDVLEKSSDDDDRLTIGGSPLVFNSFGQAFISGGSLKPWNDDVRIVKHDVSKVHNNRYNYYNLSYKFTRFRLKARAAYAVGGVFNVKSNTEMSSHNSFGFEAGLDIGYAVPLGRSVTFNIFTGVGYQSSTLEMFNDGYSYQYNQLSYGGHNYVREYLIETSSESVIHNDLVIPAYLSFDIKLFKRLLLNMDVGMKLYLNQSVGSTPFHVEGRVSGLDSNLAKKEDALGNIDKDYTEFLFPGFYENTPDMTYSVMAGLGLSVDICKGRLYFNAKCRYELGLVNVRDFADENDYLNMALPPVIYSSLNGGENIATQSFVNSVEYKRTGIWPEVGLMFKF